MADLSDVETLVVELIESILYPGGIAPAPTFPSPVVNAVVDIRRGFPPPNVLDAALKTGIALVRVYSEPGMTRNTTRFLPQWLPQAPTPQTAEGITGTVSGNTVTITGTGSYGGMVAGVAFGPAYARTVRAVLMSPSDNETTIATALAAAIPGASSSGPVLTLPNSVNPVVRSGVMVAEWLETRRQDQGLRIAIRVNDPLVRDRIASAIDGGISGQRDDYGNLLQFFPLPDGSSVWLRYRADFVIDAGEKAGLLQRDLAYWAEYPTTLIEAHPQVLFPEAPISGNVIPPPSPQITVIS